MSGTGSHQGAGAGRGGRSRRYDIVNENDPGRGGSSHERSLDGVESLLTTVGGLPARPPTGALEKTEIELVFTTTAAPTGQHGRQIEPPFPQPPPRGRNGGDRRRSSIGETEGSYARRDFGLQSLDPPELAPVLRVFDHIRDRAVEPPNRLNSIDLKGKERAEAPVEPVCPTAETARRIPRLETLPARPAQGNGRYITGWALFRKYQMSKDVHVSTVGEWRDLLRVFFLRGAQ